MRRVAFDGASRHTGFILPTVRDALAQGTPIDGLALSQALWARMCAGSRADGSKIEPNDPIWDQLTTAANEAKSNPIAWLNQSDLYGDLAQSAPFRDSFVGWLSLIWSDGAEAALQKYTAE